MLVRAKESFAGAFSMYKDQILECDNIVALQDLLKAGYIEEVTESTAKGGKVNDSKRSKSK